MPDDGVESQSFTNIKYFYWLFLSLWKKYNLQVYLDNCAYKIADKQMINYFDDNLLDTNED